MVTRACISINNRCNLNCTFCHFHDKKDYIQEDNMDVITILDNITSHIEDNDIDFRTGYSKALKQRDYLAVIRLEISNKVSDALLTKLMRITNTNKSQVMIDICPLNMSYVFSLASTFDSLPDLLYPKYKPRWPEDLVESTSIIDQVLQKDKLLFYPFDSVDPFFVY